MTKELEVDLNRKETEIVEMTRVALKPGDTLLVKVKSDYINEEKLLDLKAELSEKFPDNESIIIQVGSNQDVTFSVVGKE